MKRVSPYLKMRVLGAIEFAPGNTVKARIDHLSSVPFRAAPAAFSRTPAAAKTAVSESATRPP